MLDSPVWRLADLAARLGHSYSWMRQNIRRLQRAHGFPGTIPGCGNVYDPLAVEAWLARQRDHVVAQSVDTSPPDWATILDQRAAALGPAQGRA